MTDDEKSSRSVTTAAPYSELDLKKKKNWRGIEDVKAAGRGTIAEWFGRGFGRGSR